MNMRIMLLTLALAWPLSMTPVFSAETGKALRTTAIRMEPYIDAKAAGSLANGDPVEIIKRQGGWYQVKSAKGGGWVRMLAIRRGEARKGGIETDKILGLASGRAGTGKVVSTTGIRGLSEEELKKAKFNEAALRQVEASMTVEEELRKFAAEGKLVARKLDYLPEPN